MTTQPINGAGLSLIKSFESFVPFVYDDLTVDHSFVWKDGKKYGYRPWDGGSHKGTLTIGYGHTNAAAHTLKCNLGATVTEPEACDILTADLLPCAADVDRLVKVPLNENQRAALISFDFNTGALGHSSALVFLNKAQYAAVPARLALYDHAQGQVLEGLKRRRQAEIDLWNTKVS